MEGSKSALVNLRVERYIAWATPVAVLGVLSFSLLLDHRQGAIIPLISSFYTQWDNSLLGNVLGVVAQIIAVTMTILVTAVFVVWQYLSDKLPSAVVQPFLLGRRITLPLVVMFELFFFDLVLFFLNRSGFRPLAGTSAVLAGVLVTVPAFFILASKTVGGLSVPGLIEQLGRAATFDEHRKHDPLVMASALENLVVTLKFLVAHGHTEPAAFTFDQLLHVATTWTPKVRGHLELADGAAGKAAVVTVAGVLSKAPADILDDAVSRRDPAMFSVLIHRFSEHLPKVKGKLRREYLDCLSSLLNSDRGVWTSEFEDPLISAGHDIAHSSIHNGDEELFEFGVTFLLRVWSRSYQASGVQGFSILDDLMQMASCVERELNDDANTKETQERLKKARLRIIHVYCDLGLRLLHNRVVSVYGTWLLGLSRILGWLLKAGATDAIETLLDKAFHVYEASVHDGERVICDDFPPVLRSTLLANAKSENYPLVKKIANRMEQFMYIAVNSGNSVTILPLVDFYKEVYPIAVKEQDMETATIVIKFLSMVPLKPSIESNNIGAFLAGVMADVEDEELITALLKHLVNLIKENGTAEGTPSYPFRFILAQVQDFVSSGALSAEQQTTFVQSLCKLLPQLNRNIRSRIDDIIRTLIAECDDSNVLAATINELGQQSYAAVEMGNEELVRTITGSLSRCAVTVVNSDQISIDAKIELLTSVNDWTVAAAGLAGMLQFSQGTASHLLNLYVLMGSQVEMRPQVERDALAACILKFVSKLGTMDAVVTALTLQALRPNLREAEEQSAPDGYSLFLQRIKRGMFENKVAVAEANANDSNGPSGLQARLGAARPGEDVGSPT